MRGMIAGDIFSLYYQEWRYGTPPTFRPKSAPTPPVLLAEKWTRLSSRGVYKAAPIQGDGRWRNPAKAWADGS